MNRHEIRSIIGIHGFRFASSIQVSLKNSKKSADLHFVYLVFKKVKIQKMHSLE
jgi:hypothetical protein